MAPSTRPPSSRAARAAAAAPATTDAPLARYRSRRDFAVTSEPGPVRALPKPSLAFVIQKHDATRLHYDFRLELDGVLLSWAVPKGPSLDPKQKRLAVHVEDHPVAYATFEGTIPPGQYGAGTVLVWDRGTWEPVGDARAGLQAGKLEFRLHGRKLAGLWELVKIAQPGERQEPWLLFKKHDAWERPQAEYDVVAALPDSVIAHPLDPLDDAPAAQAGAPAAANGDPGIDPASLPGARRAALPASLSPQLATLVKVPPAHGEWRCEFKFDGYRLLTRIARGRATIFTRGGQDWTNRMPALAAELETLGLANAWLDGEAVALDDAGLPRFNRLQNALQSATAADAVVYVLFDAPFVDGLDLREVPLHARRALLKRIVDAHGGDHVRFSEDIPATVAQALRTACQSGLEGVIAKRRDGRYTSSRSADWLKLKCQERQEFVVAGYSPRSDDADAVGALTLGYHDDRGRLRDAGRVGTGWSAAEAVALRTRLAALETPAPPFADDAGAPARRRGSAVHWVRPELVAEIAFAEWTPQGRVRHASYQGLREDKPASAIGREVALAPPAGRRGAAAPTRDVDVDVDGIRITHPERVIDAATGRTKLDLARYYSAIAPRMLPHLKSRPAAFVRAPAGVDGALFFQKHADVHTMPGVVQLPGLWEGHGPLLEVPTARALVAAAQMNVIEFHTWNSVKQRIAKPDRMIFDLDPGEGVEFAAVREGARLVHTLLAELGLRAWLKTSGGAGLHVVVPMAARLDHDGVKAFSRAIVQHLARTIPQRFVARSGPRNRVGKIFVDFLRNAFNATTVAAFSARARPGLGVSMPIAWDELDEVRSGHHWTISNAPERLALQAVDPWADYAACKQSLTAAMKTLASAATRAA